MITLHFVCIVSGLHCFPFLQTMLYNVYFVHGQISKNLFCIFKKLYFMHIFDTKSKITRSWFVCFNLSKNSEKRFASRIFSLLPAPQFIFCLQPMRVLFVCDHQQQIKLQEGKKRVCKLQCVCYWEKHEDVTRQVDFNIICALSAAPLYARALGCVHSR